MNIKPHKSTTTPEFFFHIDNEATVFVRKEQDKWFGSIAIRSDRDQFSRKAGRCVARRKYFQGKRSPVIVAAERPSYDEAMSFAEDRLDAHHCRKYEIVQTISGEELLKIFGIR